MKLRLILIVCLLLTALSVYWSINYFADIRLDIRLQNDVVLEVDNALGDANQSRNNDESKTEDDRITTPENGLAGQVDRVEIYEAEGANAFDNATDYAHSSDATNRAKYESLANEYYDVALQLREDYSDLEESHGTVISRHEDGRKHIVTLRDERGNDIGNLNFVGDYLFEISEKLHGIGQHGLTVRFYSRSAVPVQIFNWRSNRLNGPYFKYSESGALIEYANTVDQHLVGLAIEWDEDGNVIRSENFVEPKLFPGP